MEQQMKTLNVVFFAILSGIASLALGDSDIFYPDADERAAPPAPLPPAAMSVVGEIRSVDESRQPRLWGEGREGVVRYGRVDEETDLCVVDNIEFGLSNIIVTWEGAASACPVGTWVCTFGEIGYIYDCNTDRPGGTFDKLDCDNTPVEVPDGDQQGWLAGTYQGYPYLGMFRKETTGYGGSSFCNSMPVWCCSEYQP